VGWAASRPRAGQGQQRKRGTDMAVEVSQEVDDEEGWGGGGGKRGVRAGLSGTSEVLRTWGRKGRQGGRGGFGKARYITAGFPRHEIYMPTTVPGRPNPTDTHIYTHTRIHTHTLPHRTPGWAQSKLRLRRADVARCWVFGGGGWRGAYVLVFLPCMNG